MHVIGSRQRGTLPTPEYIGMTSASAHDGKVLDQIRPYLYNQELYGDKAYHRPNAEAIRQAQNLTVLTPVKKQKGQRYLEPQDQWLSTAVSRVRQTRGSPIFSGIFYGPALNSHLRSVSFIFINF